MSLTRLFILLSLALWATLGQAAEPKPGSILCQYWWEVPGTTVDDLVSLTTYPNMPMEQVYLDRFEIPENQEGEFGTVIKGFIYPPADGEYTFYIASTNEGQLWLGDSSLGVESANKLVAHVPDWCAPRDWSACKYEPVQLKKGVPYYIEARHKNGGGDNHLSVAWKLPDGTLEAPIPGSRLSPGTAAIVPPPKATMAILPEQPGTHRIDVHVVYLNQRVIVPIGVDLPATNARRRASPAIVYIADPDAPIDLGTAIPPEIRNELGVITITPELPEGRSYEQRVTRTCVAAAVKALCSNISIDRKHLGLTGAGAGGTAAWRMALEMPGEFVGFSPVNALQVEDARLKQAFKGTKVRIYTDVNEGFATGRANEMHAALEGSNPKAEIIYLGPKELGAGSAVQYCYSRPEFYRDLLSLPQSVPNTDSSVARYWPAFAGLAALAVVFIAWRIARGRNRTA